MISVVVASFNGAKYIEEQILSILNQSEKVDEIIVSDDCSSDETIGIIGKIQEMSGNSVVKVRQNQKNQGYIRNFYNGISQARGDYIFLSDQDDIWEKDKVKRMIECMKLNDIDVLCSNFSLIDSTGAPYEENAILPSYLRNAGEGLSRIEFLPLLFGNIAQGCTYCLTKKIQQIYLEVDCRNVIHDYQIMLIGAALGKAFFLNETLIKYRLHGSNQVGFAQKKSLKHVKMRPCFKKPKVAEFLCSLKKVVVVPNYKLAMLILYLRLPVWRAVLNRFFR